MSIAAKYTVVHNKAHALLISDLDKERLNATYRAGHGFIWNNNGERRVVSRRMIASALDYLEISISLDTAGRGDNLPVRAFLWAECRPVLENFKVRTDPTPSGSDRDTHD